MLAFIPARGGSKGIPKKNLAVVAGKPLIVHTLEAAKRSRSITKIFVSTDDEEIAACCEANGVAVSYRRPSNLASDKSSTADAILHGLDWLATQDGENHGAVVLLQPTSPFRTSEDIDRACAVFDKEAAESLISVHAMREHPYTCVEQTTGGLSLLAKPPFLPMPRQFYPDTFFTINGAIYIATRSFIEKFGALFREFVSIPFVMDQMHSVEIDTKLDLLVAEAVYLHQLDNGARAAP